jgi:hypothetical protein
MSLERLFVNTEMGRDLAHPVGSCMACQFDWQVYGIAIEFTWTRHPELSATCSDSTPEGRLLPDLTMGDLAARRSVAKLAPRSASP